MALLASVILRAIPAALVGPGFDEAYYYLFSQHPAWGYFDHPPMVAFVAGAGQWLTRIHSPLTLRLGAIISFTLTLMGLYQVTSYLYGRTAGRLALLFPHAIPYFFAGAGAFVIPDNALTAAWIWCLYLILMLREERINRTWGFLLLGAVTGLALLSKYHAVLLPASFVIATLFDRRLQCWWCNWRLYLALIVAVVVFSPCLFWNAQNHWISFVEQFGKSTSSGLRIRFDLLGQAVGGQLLYLTPWMAVALWIGSLRISRRNRSDFWLLPFFLAPVGIFTLLGFTRGILPHWTMPGYLTSFVLAAGTFAPALDGIEKSYLKQREGVTTKLAGNHKAIRLTLLAIATNLLLITIVVLQARFGLLPIPPQADPTLDPCGWKESLAELELRGNLTQDEVLFSDRWFNGGEIGWADQNRHPIVLLHDNPHNFAWWSPPENYLGRSGVFLTQERYGLDEDGIQSTLRDRFKKVDELMIGPYRRGKQIIKMQAWRVTEFYNPPSLYYGPKSDR